MRTLAVIATTALALVVAPAAAEAAPRVPHTLSTRILTVQWGSVSAAWPRTAPSLWDKGTGLTIVEGTCAATTTDCIVVEPIPPTGFGSATGYSGGNAATGCTVWLDDAAATQFSADRLGSLVAHEVGHCLGLGHNTTDPRSVMQPVIPAKVTGPDKNDLDAAAALWP